MKAFTFDTLPSWLRRRLRIGLISVLCVAALSSVAGARPRPPVDMGDPDDPYQGPKPSGSRASASTLAPANGRTGTTWPTLKALEVFAITLRSLWATRILE